MEEKIQYSLEEFNDPDFSRLIRLTESSYPNREISNEEYLKWEYLSNPDGKAILKVAVHGEKFVAQYVILPHKFIVEKKVVQGSLSINSLTHPIHRGNTLFQKLAELTYQTCKTDKVFFTLGVPNAASKPIFLEKLKFNNLGRVPFLIKTFKTKTVLWHLFTKKRLKYGFEIHLDALGFDKNSADGISAFNPDQDQELYHDFLDKFIDEKKVATLRSLEYLKWRYVDVPIRKYYLFKSVQNGKMNALAVVRTRQIYGLNCGILMDFVCTEESFSAEGILKHILDLMQKNGIEIIITAMQSSSLEFSHLKKAGFYKVHERFLPQQLDLIIRIHDQSAEYEKLSDFKSWFFTFGDYDIF